MTNVHPDRVIDHDIDGDIELTDAGPNRRTWLKNVALGAAGATAGAMAFGKNASAGDSAGTLLDRQRHRARRDQHQRDTDDHRLRRARRSSGRAGPSVLSVGDAMPASRRPVPGERRWLRERPRRQRRARLDHQPARVRRRRRQPVDAAPRPAPSRHPRASPSLRCTDRRSSSSGCRARCPVRRPAPTCPVSSMPTSTARSGSRSRRRPAARECAGSSSPAPRQQARSTRSHRRAPTTRA